MTEQNFELGLVSGEVELKSVLASFVTGAILKARVQYFVEDLEQAISAANNGIKFSSDQPFTTEELEAIASSSVINQMSDASTDTDPLVFTPEVPTTLGVYHHAQATVDGLGLTLAMSELDVVTVLSTVRRIVGKDVPTSPTIETAVRVWNERGTVLIQTESIDDIIEVSAKRDTSVTAPDVYMEEGNVSAEGYNLSRLEVPSQTMEVPYYGQFCEVEHGKLWLGSLLEDLVSIKEQSAKYR